MTLFQQLVDTILCRKDIKKGEMYFILASVMMYFKTPLKTQDWNTFRGRIENGELSLQEAIFMTDEEKNPEIWKRLNKKTKTELEEYLMNCLFNTRKYLLKKYPELKSSGKETKKEEPVDIICIPDLNQNMPTFFSKKYIKDLLKKKVYVNELTGQPFTWETVEQIQKNKITDCTKISKKCVDAETFKKLMTRDLSQLQKLATCCIKCKNKNTDFKSIKEYQTIYFCSLKCMNDWEFEN